MSTAACTGLRAEEAFRHDRAGPAVKRGVMRTESLMRKGILATICAGVTSCVGLGFIAAQETRQRGELERVEDLLATTIADNMTNAEVYDTNGFHVESSQNEQLGADFKPDGHAFQMVSLTAAGVFRVILEKGRPMSTGGGLAIFHRDSGRPLLSVEDSDGDGALDGLAYSKVDKDGTVLLDVVDYEADGQPDMRINFADSYTELWHADRWYRVDNQEGRRGIVLNGAFVELKRENNRLFVP